MKKNQYETIHATMGDLRTLGQRLADKLTKYFGTPWFLVLNGVFFAVWIVINQGLIPFFSIFDQFPFSFLTMVVSLEAIFLSIIVLMSNNRASEIANVREEVDFQINVRAEQEITRLVRMVDDIHDHLQLGSPEDDDELKHMKKNIDIEAIRKQVLKEME